METIKKFVFNSTTGSLREREKLFDELFVYLKETNKNELPEAVFKLLGKTIVYLFPKYMDKKSKKHLIDLINLLIELNTEQSLKSILNSLDAHATSFTTVHSNHSLAVLSLIGVDLLNALLLSLNQHSKETLTASNSDFVKLTWVYANFLTSSIYLKKKQEYFGHSYKKFTNMIGKIPDIFKEFEQVVKKEIQSDSTNVTNLFLLGGFLLKYFKSIKHSGFAELKSLLIDVHQKQVIGSRNKLSISVIESVNYWVRFVEREDFKERIMPSLQRALLRNPEIVLEVIKVIFENITIDLSDFASELIPALSNQLIVKNETCQNESILAVKAFVKQCSNTESIQYILKHLFAVLNGKEGKLSTADQKFSVLTAIGNCSLNQCFGKQEIYQTVIDNLSEFLKSETHEASLHFAFQQLNACFRTIQTSNLQSAFFPKLKDFFKKLLENKAYSALIRTDIYQAMLPIYSINEGSKELQVFEKTFLQSIEKAQSNATQNVSLNTEAMAASLLLCVKLENDLESESKLQVMINAINETKKQMYTNEKFYLSLSEQGFRILSDLFEKLATINSTKEIFNLNNYFNAFVFSLLHQKYSVRKNSQAVLKRLFKWIPSKFIVSLLSAVEKMFEANNLFDTDTFKAYPNVEEANDEDGKWPSSKGVCELIVCFASIKNLTGTDLKEINLKCLLISNTPVAKSLDPELYRKFLKTIVLNNPEVKLTDLKLISEESQTILNLTTSSKTLNQSQLNAIEVLSKIDGKQMMSKMIKHALTVLNSASELNSVTKEQFEIMNLAEGELHDKSLIEAAIKQIQDASSGNANLKKENKAYSYKEQLEEIELRKELAKKSGGKEEAKKSAQNYTVDQLKSKMSKKQQEMLDAQILREKSIREEMRRLDELVRKSTAIVVNAVRGNPSASKEHFTAIVLTVTGLIRSPICANYMAQIYIELARAIAETNKSLNGVLYSTNFLESVINCFLRLTKAQVKIDSCWLHEPLDFTYPRIIAILKGEFQQEVEEDTYEYSMSSFFYPFLKHSAFQSSISEECLKNIVEIVTTFSSHRNNILTDVFNFFKYSASEDESDAEELDYHTRLLLGIVHNFPSSQFISLLFHVIEVSNERKLSPNLLTSSSEACTSIFHFSCKLLFSSNEATKLLKEPAGFTGNYKLEVDVIVKSLNSGTIAVRETSLNCLLNLVNERDSSQFFDQFFLDDFALKNLTHRIWVSCFDVDASNRALAEKIWSVGRFETDAYLCYLLVEDIVSPLENIRLAAGEALAKCIKMKHREVCGVIVRILLEKYNELNMTREPKLDQFGRATQSEQMDSWEQRTGIANAIANFAESVPSEDSFIVELFAFFVNKGFNDKNDQVKNKMLEAAIAALNYHGKTHINALLPLLEKFLEEAPKVASNDSVRQNVVILMGTLAKHLDKDDQKVAPIIDKLVQALKMPSQQVQEAVANCLPPLVPSIKAQVPNYVNMLINSLLTSQSYGERRGAAYGLAGILKGVGMLSLRQLNVLQRLNDAINNKSDPRQREGALLAYEMLTIMFNKVFEPYSVEILPNLLLCFGDADANVRQAADDCAKAVMANLTFTGVKMILPKLLERLGEEESWRTKCGSVELLGAMAHCAPKQLSTCLPNIVPKLIEILSDSHIKVQKAGTQALRQIGSVIKNPEIQAITDILLEALQEPAMKTQKALQVLLDTKFVHFIDAPSLALIMPVVQRAFQDRSTEIRKMAAQIMGNMYSLTDQKDLLPYIPSILPGLKLSLLDPVPDVRSVSSKALGAMIKAIGENGLNDIISWLMEKLVSETSSVDRSGAAQGLSEVFGALGVAKLEKSMPEIIERAIQVDLSPFVRDGYIMMFIYLPLTFGEDFSPYIGLIIKPILKALADDCEFVRETAIKAGQRIVNTYADTAISLFLPELEKGLFDLNWRIRYSSVQLLGDLLYKISGVVGKMTTESAHEDDNFGTEKGTAAIVRSLGVERRDKIFAGLYMGRSDVSLNVRQAALHVWKVIVSNTPKTLRDILPTLFNLLLGCLASSSYDKRHIAATTLVDIVRKLGERILPEIIPILEHGLKSERSEQRQGVCIALTEIMSNTSRDNILAFSDSLVPTVRRALMDPLPEVRQCAAKTFDHLHNMIGMKALDEVALVLLEDLKREVEQPEKAEWALDGLKQLVIVKSRAILPYIIPQLTQPPVNIHALCKLCSCASTEILSKHLNKILLTLVNALSVSLGHLDRPEESTKEELIWINECESLLLSIEDPDGVRTIVNELLSIATNPETKVNAKASALDMLIWFCAKTEADYSLHVDDLIKHLLSLFNEKNDLVLRRAWDCLNSVIDKLKGSNLLNRLPTIRQSIRILCQQQGRYQPQLSYYSDDTFNEAPMLIPGFCLPKKGIVCILPVFKEGLLNGAPDLKELSAQILCECIKLSDGDSLKPSVMAITGPLIRVLGERYNWTVKSAVLDAIFYLLVKVEVTLKPFLPQLQPTFMKNLVDINKTVRLKSGYALARLLFMNPKLDQIIIDMGNLIKNNDDAQVKETLINSLRLCLNNVGAKCQEETKRQLLHLLKDEKYVYSEDNAIRAVSSGALGSLAAFINDADFETLYTELLDFSKFSGQNWKYLQANCMTLATTLQNAPSRLVNAKFESKLVAFIAHSISSDRVPICLSALRAVGFYFDHQIKNNLKIESECASLLAKCIKFNSNEVKQISVDIITYLCVRNKKRFEPYLLKIFIPMLMNGTREREPSVRLSSEIAMVNLLNLKENDSLYKECLNVMDVMKESFEDCVKSLSKESLVQSASREKCLIDETIIRI